MPRLTVIAAALLLCVACDHSPVQVPPPPAAPPSSSPPPPPPPPPSSSPNHAPVAVIGGPYGGIEGSAIRFDASKSTDADGDKLTFFWDLGDGKPVTGAVIDHPYRDNGQYSARLVVRDPTGAADTAVSTVSVSNAAPAIEKFSVPDAPAGMSESISVELQAVDRGIVDTLTVTMAWGDGTTSIASDTISWSVVRKIEHSYAAVGQYQITVTVRDNDGAVVT